MAPGNVLQVFVKGLEGKTTTVDIHKDATVDDFLRKLSELNGIPVPEQRIIFSGKQLECGKRLSDYHIEHGSTVFLVLRLRGGMSSDLSPPPKELDEDVELSEAPDMITWDDDPDNKRAKMPCGHAISPESLTIYCRSLLDAGRHRFLCPYISRDTPPVYCGKEWCYVDVRRYAVLTDSEKKEFETKISRNYMMKAMGIQECPSCKSMTERINRKHVRVVCPFCTRKQKAPFEFCWQCLHEWQSSNTTNCGNLECSGEDPRLKILRDCKRKTIVGVANCPSRRACVGCGILIEHTSACKHMTCSCGKRFCFICLKPRESTGFKCGAYNSPCEPAAVQTSIPGSD